MWLKTKNSYINLDRVSNIYKKVDSPSIVMVTNNGDKKLVYETEQIRDSAFEEIEKSLEII